MDKNNFENNGFVDEDDILNTKFISLENDNEINLKFHEIKENLNSINIIKDLKDEKTILFIDLSQIVNNTANLRIFISKIKRISDTLSVTMKLYGGSWLIILPKNVNFYVGEE
jgi:SepF-like predicted cell division protein (DUF552 family)